MREMSRCLYTGGNFKQNFGKKIDSDLMVLFKTMILQFNDWEPLSLSADVFCDHCSDD